MRSLGAAFAGNENADTLNHLRGRTGTLGKKYVGAAGAVRCAGGAGDDHCRQRRLQLLCAADKLVAIHLRHVEITQQKIEGARNRLLDNFESMLRRKSGNDAVSAGFQEEGSDRECLFVVVYAEDRLLRPQGNLASAGGQP
uniref:Response regulator receiver protein n=1 Tax=uncultured bacterium 282 TaxID=698388 RepID=E3T653_9BACT|nr:response regulator receiver protein [uncultured bacterium 282]